MPLWSTADTAAGAPKFAIHGGLGVAANGQVEFDNVQIGAFKTGVSLGVTGVQVANTSTGNTHANVAHSGWVSEKVGTGYIESVAVSGNGGTGYTPGSGFITFSSSGSAGVGANATFQVNAAGNVSNVTINNRGNTYNVAVTANAAVAFTIPAVFVVTMGGRVGRREYETLVASGNIA